MRNLRSLPPTAERRSRAALSRRVLAKNNLTLPWLRLPAVAGGFSVRCVLSKATSGVNRAERWAA